MTIVHMHVHCEKGSTLDGGSRIEELIQRAKDIGSPALAITDHGSCAAIPDFITVCKKNNIKPIPGIEAYMTKDRTLKGDFLKDYRLRLCEKYGLKEKALKDFIKQVDRHPEQFEILAEDLLQDQLMKVPVDLFSSTWEVDLGEVDHVQQFRNDIYDYMSYDNYHLILIAMDSQGLEDLYAISSDAHLNGFYSNPRTDLSFIRDRGLGKHLIASSACLGGYLAHLCLSGRINEAKAFIQEAKETFYAFYLEKQASHIPDQIKLNAILDQLAVETNTPKIVTSDVHYANKHDYEAHDILVAASMGKCVADEARLKYAHDFWMKSEDEIRELVNDDEAIANTYKIAEMVNVELPKEPLFPKFPVAEGDTTDDIIRKQSWDALFTEAIRCPIDIEKYAKQLNYELEVITSLGFSDYFLIVSDFIQWLKRNGFRVGPGRGSAAGSLVAYMLKITDLDPIEWNLMFERFLNPERAGYPDIDIDVPYAGAKAVQQYLKEKYGHDKVAQIGTFGTLAARASIRLFGKTLGYSLEDQDAFAKVIPDTPKITLKDAYEQEPMVQRYAEQWPDWWETCLKFEGYTRSVGVHAGGVVLSPEPLTKVVPLRTDKEGLTTTEYDMAWIEKFLVKFDILKLDTLDLISLVLKNAGIPDFDMKSIDLNDPRIYNEIYRELNLSGIFQCESDLFRGIISEMKPNNVQDISVIVALGRPGPLDLIPSYINRKWGRERVTYPFDALESVLKDTYGVWVYQEQIMKASVVLGGFSRGQSDILRKAVAKKKHDLMEEWIGYMIYGCPEKNIEGAINRGFDEANLLKIKADWIKFGDYCFNLAHSACYAVLSVYTAYLKCYYPAEFMAALLTISEGKKDKNGKPKSAHYMQECEAMGLQILPPDIKESKDSWTPVVTQNGKAIRYGLASIAGVTSETAEDIQKLGLGFINSFDDFLYRIEAYKQVAGKTLLNKTRIIALIQAGAFDSMNPNRNLLHRQYMQYRGEEYETIPAKTSKRDILKFEKQLLGSSVSVKSRWEQIEDGKENITMTGHIVKFDILTSKKGKRYCKMLFETPEDEINIMIFDWLLKEHENKLTPGFKIQLKGKKSGNDFIANKIVHVQENEQTWDVAL